MPLLVGLSGKRKMCYVVVFLLTYIFIVHRNRLLAQLFLDLLELKVSFTMQSMLELWLLEAVHTSYIHLRGCHITEIEIEFYLL